MSKTEEALPAEVGFALLLNHLKQWRRSGIDDEPIKVAEECFHAAIAQRQQVPLTDEHISALYVSGWGAYCSRSSFIAIFREAERVHRIGKQEG